MTGFNRCNDTTTLKERVAELIGTDEPEALKEALEALYAEGFELGDVIENYEFQFTDTGIKCLKIDDEI